MAKERTPRGQVRAGWKVSCPRRPTRRAPPPRSPYCGTPASLGQALSVPHSPTSARLATLLREPFAELRSDDPVLDAELVAHAVVGLLTDLLWGQDPPGN